MRKQVIFFAQVIQFLQNIKLERRFNSKPLPLRTPLLGVKADLASSPPALCSWLEENDLVV